MRGQLAFTGRRVPRGVIELTTDSHTAFRRVPIPLARCAGCRYTARVLPAEILPRKTYVLPVIETAARRYVAEDGPGLRTVVQGLGDRAPDHATLHRWLDGLGERGLDHHPPAAPIPTAAALIVESERRWAPRLRSLPPPADKIPAWKYRSEERLDRLRACVRLFASADALVPGSRLALTEWHRKLIGVFGVPAWGFRTGPLNTPMQLPRGRASRIESRRTSRTRSGGASHGPRSPPHRRVPL